MKKTPVTEEGLKQFDELRVTAAIFAAWNFPGKHPKHHEKMKQEVRDAMPVLGRALDRL